MAKVLEGLIARGRRVHHAREQRDVAFGLADLSTHGELHDRIVTKGGIKTLVHLLTTSQDVEAQRFSALAIANTSCAEEHRVQVANLDNSLMHMTNYINSEEFDLMTRQYCAMALGNLAADPENHENIVKLGGVVALILLLRYGANEQDFDSARYASFALANLAANSHYRKIIVDEGAIEPLILISCFDDLNVQRHAMSVLRGLCITYEYRSLVVEKGILDPLVLMARTDNIEILREVVAGLNCLSSVPENKKEVTNRAISTIIALLISGDPEVERHSCCTLANLVEVTELHHRILEENGVPPLVSIFSSDDLNCKGEGARAIANLSSNKNTQKTLLEPKMGVLDAVVSSLEEAEVNCQRFSALCLANLSTSVSSQIQVVQAGAIRPLINLVQQEETQLEARRYSALALANLSATSTNHAILLEEGCLSALFSLCNSPDVMSQFYVGRALSNLSSNVSNHNFIVEEGGVQSLVTLAYSQDSDVHQQAAAALRGLSASGDIKMKIVQEGGLEPLGRLLLSREIELLREVTACFCNLSLSDENKNEVARCGVIPALITRMQTEDMEISSFCCACLANLAEISENQELIVMEGAIKPCLKVMRSRHVEVQREGGRLLANICACDLSEAADIVIENDGHHLLISFLLAHDPASQRVGAFGIGNLCTQQRHRITLRKASVLEPLSSLARSNDVNIEVQKFAMLALVNLADEIENHPFFIDERILQSLISLSNSQDRDIRQYAAVAVVKIAKNMDVREKVTNEGGLEPVLYLARTENKDVRRETLPAITTLSFVEKNKVDICQNGGLFPMMQEIWTDEKNNLNSKLACSAIANLLECTSNMPLIVDNGFIPLLVKALQEGDVKVQSEASRALGTLSANLDYGKMILKHTVLPQLMSLLRNDSYHIGQRMAAMALSNLASNTSMHIRIMASDIFSPLVAEFQASLDPKCVSDHETTRFCLVLVANLATTKDNQEVIINRIIDMIIQFTKHRDIKIRQHAVIILGNLSSNVDNADAIHEARILPILISFSFPTTATEITNAQFLSISGIRGIAMNKSLRIELVALGCMEPLILAVGGESCVKDVEVRREAAATLCNLALAEENGLPMVQSGVVRALISLIDTNDSVGQVFSIGTIANLAQRGQAVQSRLLEDGCLSPLVRLMDCSDTSIEARKEVARCVALFANNIDAHDKLLHRQSLRCITALMRTNEDITCQRFGSLAVGNLALFPENHETLLASKILDSVTPLVNSADKETQRCIAYTLHNLCQNKNMHLACENYEVAKSLADLLDESCKSSTKLHASLAMKYFSTSMKGREQFVEVGGLPNLLKLAKEGGLEVKREVAATLRNLSLSDNNKIEIRKEGGVDILVHLCRSKDEKLAHQACGVIANLAELPSNQRKMVEAGILHHLKFAMRSSSVTVVREAIRSISNISSDFLCTSTIVSSGVLAPLVRSLSLEDHLSRRFATMSIANLATNNEIQHRVIDEGGIAPLLKIAAEGLDGDKTSKSYAFFALTNVSAHKERHQILINMGIVNLSVNVLGSSDRQEKLSAALCLANLSSGSSCHGALIESQCFDSMISLLGSDERQLQLRSVSYLRGLSANSKNRSFLTERGIVELLLELATTQDVEIQMETLSALCNISLGGYIGSNPQGLLEKIQTNNLISFLCSSNSTYRLFGALSIGNIVSDTDLLKPVLGNGALLPLIDTANSADMESLRCISYAICNICSSEPNRVNVVRKGGLLPLLSLTCSSNNNDVLAALSTIRGLASCHEIRRDIVVGGALEPLFTCLERCAHHDECVKEATLAICALSLNEENKKDIVNSNQFVILISGVNMTNEIAVISLRILGNCAENQELHRSIFTKVHNTSLFRASLSSMGTVSAELCRFYCNLCSNPDMHQALVQEKVPQILIDFSRMKLERVTRYCILGLMNLTTETGNHQHLNELGSDFFDLLFLALSNNDDTTNTTKIQIKRYACLTVGSLARTKLFDDWLSKEKLIDVLAQLLQNHDEELRQNALFALNKLAATQQQETRSKMKKYNIDVFTVNHAFKVSINERSHGLATLRHLSSNDEVRVNIMKGNGLRLLEESLDAGSNEIKREVAAILFYLTLNDACKKIVVKSSILSSIIILCKAEDTESARFAIGAVANIVEDVENHDTFVQDEGVFHFLSTKMRVINLSLKRESCRAVSNLLSTGQGHNSFIKAGGLESLNIAACSLDQECQYCVALSFAKLASDISNHNELLHHGCLHVILNLTKSRCNKGATHQAAAALRDLASNRDYKVKVALEGGMQASIDLLLSEDAVLATTVASVLQRFSISTRLKLPLYDSGVIEPLSKCLLNANKEDLLYHCTSTIANITEHIRNRHTMWQEAVISSLFKMAYSPDIRIKGQVARAFCLLSSVSKEDIPTCFQERVIKALTHLSSSKNNEIAADVAAALGNIAKTRDLQTLVCNHGGFLSLANLLSSTHEGCQISASKALANVMTSVENLHQCAEETSLIQNLLQLCQSSNQSNVEAACIAICNLSSCQDAHNLFLGLKGTQILLSMLTCSSFGITIFYSIAKSLCNFALNESIRSQIMSSNGLPILLALFAKNDEQCNEIAMMCFCNLTSEKIYNSTISLSGILKHLARFSFNECNVALKRAAALTLYNLTSCEQCHVSILKKIDVKHILSLCRVADHKCRQYSTMILCNLSANSKTRRNVTKAGGLQTMILMLKDDDIECRTFASMCLTNLANNDLLQNQVVLHGGLPALFTHMKGGNKILQKCATMCVVNLAANELNHEPLMNLCIIDAFTTNPCANEEIRLYRTFGISNLLSNDEIVGYVGANSEAVKLLLLMLQSKNRHSKCLSLISLRRILTLPKNRDLLVDFKILLKLNELASIEDIEIKVEVTACLCLLSEHKMYRSMIIRKCLPSLVNLFRCNDSDVMRQAAGAFGNLAEHHHYHTSLRHCGAIIALTKKLGHNNVGVKREVIRSICNILSSSEDHVLVVTNGLGDIVALCGNDDQEIQHSAALTCRKLVQNPGSHEILIHNGLPNLLRLLHANNFNTRWHAAITLRDLCGYSNNQIKLVTMGCIAELIYLLKHEESEMKTLALASLRHLSCHNDLKRQLVQAGVVRATVEDIHNASDDFCCQAAGLVANLSELDSNRSELVKEGIIAALLILSRMANVEILQDVSRTLANLSACEDIQVDINRQGGVSCLLKLNKTTNIVSQRYTALAIRFLVSNAIVRKAMVKEENIKPLTTLSSNHSLDYKRSVAAVFSYITMEDHGKLQLMKSGTFKTLLGLCQHSDLQIQREATCAVANVSNLCELHPCIVQNGSIHVFESLSESCVDTRVLREVSRFLSSISINNTAKSAIVSNTDLLSSLIRFSRVNDPATQRYSILAICNLSLGLPQKEKMLENEDLLRTLIFLARYPDLEIERSSVLTIASLAIGAKDKLKETITTSGILKPLINIMKYPDEEVQKCSSLALNVLMLGKLDNVKSKLLELENNNGIGVTLLELIRSTDEECIHNAIYALGTLVEFEGFRDTLIGMGCIESVTRIISNSTVEAKRACGYLFAMLAENSQYHERLHRAGAMEEIIKLANLVDIECQVYGAFAIAFIANNPDFQVIIVKLGAVRPLVSMMATNSEPKHYAGLALLKLADNFENHITIAEEGGIQALLKLGRSRVANEEMQYKAALTVGTLASNEVSKLPNLSTTNKESSANIGHVTKGFKRITNLTNKRTNRRLKEI